MTKNVLAVLVLMLFTLSVGLPSAAQDTTECEAGFRLFDHELLATAPVCVPENPQRVVSLDPFSYELLLLNDTPPVGAVGYLETVYSGNFPYLSEEVAAVESVGSPPNVEAILALNPDLIIGSYLPEELQPQLAAIAPTVSYVPAGSGDWKRPMRLVGDLLGLSDLVDDLFVQYEARLADLGAAVEDPSEIEVSIIRVQPDQLMLNLVNSFPAVVVTDAGLGRPASQVYSEAEATEVYGGAVGAFISLEEIQLADGDYIFAWSNQGSAEENADADANWETVQASPLWNSLTAAQNGTAYRVGGHWLGWGIFAAHDIIDDLFTYIAGVDPVEVSPNPFLTAETVSAECQAGFRLFDHELLATDPVCVPENPQRVVVLNTVAFNTLLDINIIPVSAFSGFSTNYMELRPDLGSNLDSIADVGSYNAPNLEAVLELTPDLILADAFLIEQTEVLGAIAPVVMLGSIENTSNWQSYVRFFADAVSQSDAAEQLIAAYEARSAALQAQLSTSTSVSIVRVLPEDIRLYLPLSFAGSVIQDAGLPFPEAQGPYADEPRGIINISLEEIDLADADTIFLFTTGGNAAPEDLQALQENQLWQSLEAVQQERVYPVGGHWVNLGLYSAHAILDDLFTYVAGVDPMEVAPSPFAPSETEG